MKNNSKNSKIIKFEELSWKQIDKLDRNKTIFFLPISPLEEHGPHLPVGTDLMTIKDAATEAIKLLNQKKPELDYVILPAIPIGYCDFNTDFPGSISVSGKVVRDVVYSVGESLGNHGFKFLVICTFHMAITHLRGINSAMKKLQSRYGMKTIEPWGPFFYNKEIEKREPKLGFDTTKEVHACFRETSLMKYQYPYLVDPIHTELKGVYRDLSSPKVIGKTFKELGIKDGYIGNPSKADVTYGRWFYQLTVDSFVNAAIAMYQGKPVIDLPQQVKSKLKLLFWQ